MSDEIVVYTPQALAGGPPFPQWSATSFATTQSFNLQNNSQYELNFEIDPGNPILVPAYNQALIPGAPNTQYRIYPTPGATIPPPITTYQVVTITESDSPVVGILITPTLQSQAVTIGIAGAIAGFTSLPDTSVIAVGLMPTPLPTVPLNKRVSLMIQASELNTALVYIGGPNVTTSRTAGSHGGVSLAPQQTYTIDAANAVPYAIADVTGQIVIVQEGAIA